MSACAICASPDQDRLEALGRDALAGTRSWRSAAMEGEVRDRALKNHMHAHVVAPAVAEATQEREDHMDALIAEARAGLETMFYTAPADVQPLILVAMQNL
ncbi:MAG: hypothetical protein ACXVXO_09535, partial [Mycobacteriaceae bacterium]